jgi:hypothetical protein
MRYRYSKNTLLLIIYNILICFVYSDKLRFVFNIFRHGARAPYFLNKLNKDLFDNYWESESKITSVGIRQHYLNGIRTRQKYFSRLNITEFNFNPNEIGFFSTNTDRTLMSAYSQLFGMFTPGTGQVLHNNDEFLVKISEPPIKNFDFSIIKSNLNSSAIASKINIFPVKIFDKKANYFDLHDPANCPPIKAYQDENEKGAEFQNFLTNFRKIYGERILRIINKTNSPEFLNSGWNVYKIFDAYESNFFEGKDLSKFTNERIDLKEFKNLTTQFLYFSDFIYNFGDKNSWVARFSFSPILEYLLDLIDARILLDKTGVDIYDSQHPKMLFYSGHDTNLSAIQKFIKYAFGEKIILRNNYFASVFSFEIYQNGTFQNDHRLKNRVKDIEDTYYLKIFFNEIDYLGGPLKYSEFKKVIKNNIIPRQEINSFCGFNSNLKPDINYIYIIILCFLLLFISGLVYLIFKYKNLNADKFNQARYKVEYQKM